MVCSATLSARTVLCILVSCWWRTGGQWSVIQQLMRRCRAEQVGGWRFGRAVVTPPGVDRALFPPLDQPPERPWRWRLLWIGRVVAPKGVMTAIQALGLPVSV